MTETILFNAKDHSNRLWLITCRPHGAQLVVTFICWNAAGTRKVLDQTSAWGADGWDLARPWLPASPRPVPEVVLATAERQLKELVRQQQEQDQQGGGVADPIREALCELCKAVQEQFFGADSDLSPRVIKATNEAAQLLCRLDAQPTHTAARTALAAEPAFVASEPSDDDLADLAEVFNGDPLPAMRRALELWGRPTISALAAKPPAPGPTIDDIWQLCEDHEFHLGMDGANEEESAEGLLEIINTALGRWGRPAPVPAAEGPAVPDEVREAFAELERREHNLRVFRNVRAAMDAELPAQPPAPVSASDGEREELAQWLEQERPDYGIESYRLAGKRLHRAAALLRGPAPAPKRVVLPEKVPTNVLERQQFLTTLAADAYRDGCRDTWVFARAEVERQQGRQQNGEVGHE